MAANALEIGDQGDPTKSTTYEGDSRKTAVIMYPGRDTPSPFKINNLVNFSHGGNTWKIALIANTQLGSERNWNAEDSLPRFMFAETKYLQITRRLRRIAFALNSRDRNNASI